MPQTVEWSMSPKELAAFEKRLERFRDLPLRHRMAKGTLAAAQYLARPVRADAPVGRTGKLKKSIRARQTKASGLGTRYATLGASVGPTAPHRHLVIRPHRIVTHKGRDTGRKSRANAFVDRAVHGNEARAFAIVSQALFGPD